MFTNTTLRIGAFLGMLAVNQFVTSAIDKSYVDAVKADVDEFTSGQFNPPSNSPWVPGTSRKGVAAGTAVHLADFNKILRAKMRGSFIRYQQLPEWQQVQIYQTYEKTGDLDRVKREILETIH